MHTHPTLTQFTASTRHSHIQAQPSALVSAAVSAWKYGRGASTTSTMLKTAIPRRPLLPLSHVQRRWATQPTHQPFPPDIPEWSHPPSNAAVSDEEIFRLAAKPRRPLTLADLVRHGKPPLRDADLLSSANFTVSLLPARLAHRIQALRNLPFIVVANPNVSQIYNNYLHSLATLAPFYKKPIETIDEEMKFTEAMADLVRTHSNTIPTLAKGFLQCRKYIDPAEVTRFLDQHLRARIGTRLVAEQHLALHMASTGEAAKQPPDPNHVGVIDLALRPADIVRRCEEFVSEVCELNYGVRPTLVINGDKDAEFAHIPMHLEYIITELLKNAFRATLEAGNEREPVEVTIASAPEVSTTKLQALRRLSVNEENSYDFSQDGLEEYCSSAEDADIGPLNSAAPCITLRIRDRGGGIPPEALPSIWSYSFTTFNNEEAAAAVDDNGTDAGLNAIASSGSDQSSIAGLGYGLPLSRAYAEYFGGGISLQSMYGWGTDVYLTLQGIGKVDELKKAPTGLDKLNEEMANEEKKDQKKDRAGVSTP
ncbi:hypothetical protein HRR90_002278 [Exophiala dermatitidis]|nr:hypothetical protein HRR73_004073 [Exophiala dermatitidis]KAJ4533989.1 hypothetical protein HRR76_005937 [Exophiala dermatitidis]KAJ4550145.1 hypothetical protein HRR77_003623 [Exophiala dermatitidis]KAJ4577733.1 hypothetical protein HRR79_001068 [Exophiala dermatitidis]KAJ4657614.1 hypothetical protein HRR90_002278 [Exophiala dermatitidis]